MKSDNAAGRWLYRRQSKKRWKKNSLSELLSGKTVLVGRVTLDAQDIHLTPLGPVPGVEIHGNTSLVITGLSIDSRKIDKGFVFAALKGTKTDGHGYITTALQKGATVIICEILPAITNDDCCFVRTDSVADLFAHLAFAFYGIERQLKVIGVTGTNGKTTTTRLIYHLLKTGGLDVGLGGNIGLSFAAMVAQEPKPVYVLELSSFQLDGILKFRPDISVLLNITPDHLDRYQYNLQNYVDAKFRITQNQTDKDVFIYCAEDEVTLNNINKHNINAKQIPFAYDKDLAIGAHVINGQIISNISTENLNPF
jgi:UDP-N-acetylmuramyl pentapeptide synthase